MGEWYIQRQKQLVEESRRTDLLPHPTMPYIYGPSHEPREAPPIAKCPQCRGLVGVTDGPVRCTCTPVEAPRPPSLARVHSNECQALSLQQVGICSCDNPLDPTIPAIARHVVDCPVAKGLAITCNCDQGDEDDGTA